MTRKRYLIGLFVVLLSFGMILSACSSSNNTASNEQEQGASAGEETTTSNETQNTEKEKEEPEFPSKNINFIVPVSPGGGFDTIARMVVPYWEKHLPGDHKIVVKNMPGGAWNIGLSAIMNAEPDGHTVGIVNMPGNVANQIVGKAQYDLKKFVPLGRVSDVVYVMAASKKSGITSIEDLKKKGSVKLGTVSLSSTAGLTAVIALEALGVEVTPVPHDGSSEAILSGVRGSVDIVQYPFSSLKSSIVDSDELTPIVVYNSERLPELPDTPTIVEAGYDKLADVVHMHRILVASPGTPEAETKILADSLEKALAEEEFKQKMIEMTGAHHPGNAEMAKNIILNSFGEMEKYKELIESAMAGE